jgi:hypothetical protein
MNATTTFSSYGIETKSGRKYLVINETDACSADGGKALKCRRATYAGQVGWSGGARPVYQFSESTVWIKASAVAKRVKL